VRSALPLLRRELEDAGVALSLELEADLPPVAGDAIQLQQVVVNLLKNACEALSSSPQPGRISVRTFAENGWVTLTVTDSGPGLPPGFEQRLFRPFVSGRPGGLGLGLAICATIVEAHGGRISAGNAAGGGAEFAVQLTAHME